MQQDDTKRYVTHKLEILTSIGKHQFERNSTIQDTVLQTFNQVVVGSRPTRLTKIK